MFDNVDDTLPDCAESSVYAHMYHVDARMTDGAKLISVSLMAGSIAHASVLVGMMIASGLIAEGLEPEEAESAMHGITNHLIVDVSLLV